MNLKEALKYQKDNNKKPTNIILAFEEPEKLNSVILYGIYRVKILKQLTRIEFEQQLKINLSHKDSSVTADTCIENSKIKINTNAPSEIPEGMKYFYSGELV